jgi:outer membrane protein assembly factor BamD
MHPYLNRIRPLAILAIAALPVLGACGSSNPYQGMDDEQIYQMALRKFDERNWNDAIRALDRYLAGSGTGERAADARLLLAKAYFGKKDFLTARSEFQRFLDRFPSHQESAAAALGMCTSLTHLSPTPQRDQSYTNEALGVCRNVALDYAGTTQGQEAARLATEMRRKLAEKDYLNADFYFRRKLHDSAIKYYEFVLELYGDTEWAPWALLGIYRSNKAIGYDDLADEARERLLAEYPDSPAAAELRANGSGA